MKLSQVFIQIHVPDQVDIGTDTEFAVDSGAVNISEPRENLLFDCVVEPSPKDSE